MGVHASLSDSNHLFNRKLRRDSHELSLRETPMVTFSTNHVKIRSRIVIIDDHEAIIEMMTPIIDSMPGYSVVGHALDGGQAMEICRREHPDVIILDLV